MDIAKVSAERRDGQGTRSSRRLRREGKLPGIIYGHQKEPAAVAVAGRDVANLLERGAHVVELQVNGKAEQVLIKDVQYDHLGLHPIHVDFARVDLTEQVRVSVPLAFRGTPAGTHEGGLFEQTLVDLEIECRVTEIPASIRVNVGELKLGEMIHVKDLELPAGVKAAGPPDAIVCSVRAKAAAEAEEAPVAAEGEPAQPEIIGRKEKEKDAEEEASS